MLNRKTLKTLRSDCGIDELVKRMITTSSKIANFHRDLAELKRRVYDREKEVEEIELSFQVEANQNGKNEAERKAMFKQFCAKNAGWVNTRKEADDATFHRDMMQAELDGLYARLSAQRSTASLITATLNASIE